jgi:hypothetical protein
MKRREMTRSEPKRNETKRDETRRNPAKQDHVDLTAPRPALPFIALHRLKRNVGREVSHPARLGLDLTLTTGTTWI